MDLVKNFDMVLFKMWIFYRYDVCGVEVSPEEAKHQKYRTLSLFSCLTFGLLRYIGYIQASSIGGVGGTTPYPLPRAADPPPPPPAGGERSEPPFFSGFFEFFRV